jgi:hypothetical protein
VDRFKRIQIVRKHTVFELARPFVLVQFRMQRVRCSLARELKNIFLGLREDCGRQKQKYTGENRGCSCHCCG